METQPHLHRVRLFMHLVWRPDHSGKRMSPKLAWRVAGIASGHVEAMPDSVLSWWWKMHDLLPGNEPKAADAAAKARVQDTSGK
jgi:hypothetical protein